jgi:hypothetical protein
MATNSIPVYGRFDSKASDGVLAVASQVLDETQNKSQSDINESVAEQLTAVAKDAGDNLDSLKKEVIEKLKAYLTSDSSINITGPGTDEYPSYQLAVAQTAIDLFSDLVLNNGQLTLTTTKGTTKSVTKDQFTAQLGIDTLSSGLTTLTNAFNDFLHNADVADTTINTWKEIENFLQGITDSDTLTSILQGQYEKITQERETAVKAVSDRVDTLEAESFSTNLVSINFMVDDNNSYGSGSNTVASISKTAFRLDKTFKGIKVYVESSKASEWFVSIIDPSTGISLGSGRTDTQHPESSELYGAIIDLSGYTSLPNYVKVDVTYITTF